MTCLKIFKNKPTLNVDVKPFKKYLGALLLFIDEILVKILNKLLNIRDIIKVIWGLLFELHEGSIFIKHLKICMIHKIYFFKWSTFEQSSFYLPTKYKFRSAKFFPIHLLLNNKNGQGSLPLTHEKTANRIMNFFFRGGEENHFNFTRFSYIILNLYHVIQIKTWKMGDKKNMLV